jgi:glutamate N-acetyltransferase/amino-acid N-acetyltransferase
VIPKGFRFAGTRCGLKSKRNDVGLILSDLPTCSAGLFTQNLVHAACVDYTREVVAGGRMQAVVVNSGNANCCTGAQGERDTRRAAELAAECLGLDPKDIGVASTGVIGHLLDMGKLERGVLDASQKLAHDPKPFMEAILTTDLVEKWARWEGGDLASPKLPAEVGSGPCVYGVCKGSGMIAPNMATMLAFVVTDFDVTGIDIQASLRSAAAKSFNCTTVDSDTSTNDMVLLLANGASGVRPSAAEFQDAIDAVCVSLAQQIARDGEGASKLVEVRVTGTSDPSRVARTIGDSPLVKTAMFGCDPNWGRILAAAGRAGVSFHPGSARLVLEAAGESFTLYEDGGPAAFDPKRVSSALKSDHVVIDLQLGEGETAIVYTCDFGYGYVRINAEYHT